MQEKKNLHIPPWKVWVLVITTAQAINAIQSFRIHQQMWEKIYHVQSLMNQVLQNDAEYHQDSNYILDLLIQKLQEQRE